MSASSSEALHLLLAGAWVLGIQTEAGLVQGCEGWYTRSHTAARLSPLGSQNMNSGLFFFLNLPFLRSAAELLRHLFWNWQECDPKCQASSLDFCLLLNPGPVILPSPASSLMNAGRDLKILGIAFLAGWLV